MGIWVRGAIVAAVVFGMGSCSPEDFIDENLGAATIVSFEASRSSIDEGESVTLSWVTRDAKTLRLVDDRSESIDLLGADIRSGSVEVSPFMTSNYRLIAIGANRKEVASEVRIEVRRASLD